MQCLSFPRRRARPIAAAVSLLVCATTAHADSYGGGVLTIPSLVIGNGTYSSVAISPITVGDVLSYTPGGTANGSADSYDPVSGQLTIPAITVGGNTYTDVVVAIPAAASVAIGGVTGVDTYSNGELSIPFVQLRDGAIYFNVLVKIVGLDSVDGGMPHTVQDLYDPVSGQLTIAAIEYNGRVYTNAVVTPGKLVSLGGAAVAVPNVVGATQAAATTTISAAGLSVGSVTTQPSRTVAAGLVLGESPIATTGLRSGSAVSLVVSSGSPVLEYVYAANHSGTSVSQFLVGAGGALGALSPATAPAGNGSVAIAVDPTGSFAYVANATDGSVSQYLIGPGGALNPNNPATVLGLDYPYSVTVGPTGTYAYVVNNGNGSIAQFSINAGGALSPLSPATVGSGSGAEGVTVDPTGSYAYVACYGSGATLNASVYQYAIGAGGALSPMNPPSVEIAQNIGVLAVAVDPQGPYAYVASGSYGGGIYQFTIGSNGALTPMSTANLPVDAHATVTGIAVDPKGRYVYESVADFAEGSYISVYVIGTGGGLVPMSTTPAGSDPTSITVDHSGSYVYATDYQGVIWQYSIGAQGALTPLNPASVADPNNPYGIASTP